MRVCPGMIRAGLQVCGIWERGISTLMQGKRKELGKTLLWQPCHVPVAVPAFCRASGKGAGSSPFFCTVSVCECGFCLHVSRIFHLMLCLSCILFCGTRADASRNCREREWICYSPKANCKGESCASVHMFRAGSSVSCARSVMRTRGKWSKSPEIRACEQAKAAV